MRAKFIFVLCLILMVIGISPPAKAQTSTPPPSIICSKIENYGNITTGSVNHPRQIVMNYGNGDNGQYLYSAYVDNWHDGGGGQNASASYDAVSGKLVNSTDGIVCPPAL